MKRRVKLECKFCGGVFGSDESNDPLGHSFDACPYCRWYFQIRYPNRLYREHWVSKSVWHKPWTWLSGEWVKE